MNEVTNNTEMCDKALEELHEVIDPEIGLNVVDLGLIYQLDFDSDKKSVYCTMTLTTQFCPMGESITTNVTQCLEQTFPEYAVNINLIFEPPWSMEKISPEGQDWLNGGYTQF
ncbi:MAG: metal-sulfur cluster assembly factor [Chitinophagaceae bacterium]|nr:metal-sulfur cluster assembly factor [Chitinophagaceae bacterium]